MLSKLGSYRTKDSLYHNIVENAKIFLSIESIIFRFNYTSFMNSSSIIICVLRRLSITSFIVGRFASSCAQHCSIIEFILSKYQKFLVSSDFGRYPIMNFYYYFIMSFKRKLFLYLFYLRRYYIVEFLQMAFFLTLFPRVQCQS